MAARLRQSLVVGFCIAAAILLLVLAKLINQDPACTRLRARVDLATKFCDGLAERAAGDRCQSLSENPEVQGQCLRIMRPAAHSGCMDYLNLEAMKRDLSAACD